MLKKQSWKDQVLGIKRRHFLLQDCCNVMQQTRPNGDMGRMACGVNSGSGQQEDAGSLDFARDFGSGL